MSGLLYVFGTMWLTNSLTVIIVGAIIIAIICGVAEDIPNRIAEWKRDKSLFAAWKRKKDDEPPGD
jgi:hypothetical protein